MWSLAVRQDQRGRLPSHLQIQVEDVLTVEITNSFTDLSQEVSAIGFCQSETLLGDSLKEFTAVEVLQQNDELCPAGVTSLVFDYFLVTESLQDTDLLLCSLSVLL